MSTAAAGSHNLLSADALGQPTVEQREGLLRAILAWPKPLRRAFLESPSLKQPESWLRAILAWLKPLRRAFYGMSKRRGMQITPRLSRRSRDVRSRDELIRTIVGVRRSGCGSTILDDLSCSVEWDECGSTADLCCGRAPAAFRQSFASTEFVRGAEEDDEL
jgi:hypothetical protein